ncbi:Reverse transcriptase/retrotransposon-derived protein [Theobroma cacao]|nr:Reverse transcriptase/retrotransposon-derived protein [Theobroma cacao]
MLSLARFRLTFQVMNVYRDVATVVTGSMGVLGRDMSDACEDSFEKLKACLTTTLVLSLLQGTGGYTVFCDASRVGLGFVLMQHGKANVVADALSRKSMGSLEHISTDWRSLIREMHSLGDMGVHLEVSEANTLLAHFRVRPILIDRIREAQGKDEFVTKAIEDPQGRKGKILTKGTDGVLRATTAITSARMEVGNEVRQERKIKSSLQDDLTYEEQSVAILDKQVKKLCSKEVASVKVLWQNHTSDKLTWEADEEMRTKFQRSPIAPFGPLEEVGVRSAHELSVARCFSLQRETLGLGGGYIGRVLATMRTYSCCSKKFPEASRYSENESRCSKKL